MQYRSVNELRRLFLDFFAQKEHLVMNSFSLVPHNDNSLLLINSGMAPLKPYFTGQEIPPRRRVATCQKCVRTGDIENVGKTARHLTFFEMLGNFSFGDYFKKEAIAWSWEFLTQDLGMDPARLYPSIYFEDEEAFEIWTKDIGVAPERITRFYRDENGKCDNFWEHGAGPCGPCSEIYYDRGEAYGCDKPDCKVGCDCDRYMEVWNNVFTQYNGDGQGHYEELEQKNIDTGMGLERLAVAVQDVGGVFDIDSMRAIRDRICSLSGAFYGKDAKADISIRLITDHIRSATFLVSDGILPSNEGRGYVLRRLIRRAARHGRMLGAREGFLANLAQTVIEGFADGYPELEEKRDFILRVLGQEEEKFAKTIDQGLAILEEMVEGLSAAGSRVLDGDSVFKLYDTYGFPVDLTTEILEEKGLSIDGEGFAAAMEQQRRQARSARKATNYMGAEATVYEQLDPSLQSEFVGYGAMSGQGHILALTTESQVVEALVDGEGGTLIVDKSHFYPTMGGQCADKGRVRSKGGEFAVEDTIKLGGGKIGLVGRVTKGMLCRGEAVEQSVDVDRRLDIAKNHSATHLLHKALKQTLGSHVEQAGSMVDADRLRFDFSHFGAMSPQELDMVELAVNRAIAANWPVITKEMGLEEAKAAGATALFGEKYGQSVRVVSMGEYSMELCGGTHVPSTGMIGCCKIVQESGVAAGVRRIEAVTGLGVLAHYASRDALLENMAAQLKAPLGQAADKLANLLKENKRLQSELEALKNKAAKEALGDVESQISQVAGVPYLAKAVEGVEGNALRELADQMKERLAGGVIVLFGIQQGKVSMVAMASEEAQAKGAHAGNLIKALAPLVGGGGGGRPAMAQAGGKNPQGVPGALDAVGEQLALQLRA